MCSNFLFRMRPTSKRYTVWFAFKGEIFRLGDTDERYVAFVDAHEQVDNGASSATVYDNVAQAPLFHVSTPAKA